MEKRENKKKKKIRAIIRAPDSYLFEKFFDTTVWNPLELKWID